MGFLPKPESRPVPLGDVRFLLKYENSHVRLGDPALDDAHIHNDYELYLNLSGDVSFLVNNRVYAIRRGDLVITRPGNVHLCILHRSCIHEHFCLWLDVPSGHPLVAFADHGGSAFWRPTEDAREELIAAFFRMKSLLAQDRPLAVTASLLSILTMAEDRADLSDRPSKTDLPPELQNILDVMNTRFYEFRNVTELLSETFVSPATLNRWFRRYVHLSPRTFLESKKLSYAQELLRSGCSVSEASEKAGFSDCSYFISVFRRKFGETPLRYKQLLSLREER
ncbi:MAG: helix-turn-helix domain-containing protein [Clostridia bacterium]|nr:helix-turn-helix domain-containing protein [Clostridia bacterium]